MILYQNKIHGHMHMISCQKFMMAEGKVAALTLDLLNRSFTFFMILVYRPVGYPVSKSFLWLCIC